MSTDCSQQLPFSDLGVQEVPVGSKEGPFLTDARRLPIRWLVAALVFWTFAPHAAASTLPKRPNILVILTDQQSAGMMSCAGNLHLKTPAMDSLARNGARFELAYCANPVCSPSRVAMTLGVMPSRIGMEANEDSKKANVSESILRHSLGNVLRAGGYHTAYGGKVHLPVPLTAIGFESITRDERVRLADECAAFLSQKHEKPFLLVASFINPHDICYMAIESYARAQGKAPPELADVKKLPASRKALAEAMKLPPDVSREEFFRKLCPPLPANFEVPRCEPAAALGVDPRAFRLFARRHWSVEQWRLHRWAYCRLTERVDGEMATVLRALRETGLEDNTLVVFTSDHGDMDSAHRLEHKSILYEEATRVPLIVSFKGVTRQGLVDRQHLVSTGLDLIPTLCDYARIACPVGLNGRSVRSLSEAKPVSDWRQDLVVESNHSRMLRTVHFKYTVYDSGQRREVLIDLAKDPGEMQNLAEDPAYREVLQEHRRLLRQWYSLNGEQLDAKYVVP
jgi:choline-sulfatase